MSTSLTQTFMAPTGPKDAGKRPNPLRSTKSFSRPEAQDASAAGRSHRASTIQNGAVPEIAISVKAPSLHGTEEEPDTFESANADDPPEPPRASVDLDDLPIELISLTDSFIDSLSAKVHPTPPNIETLSHMFQEFYSTASSHIATHIATLATRQMREHSPTPSNSSRASAASLLRAKTASMGTKEKGRATPVKTESELQMITAEELADRKRARRALELKRGLLEEAVERRLCEGIYGRIYRHRSTQDEAQDDKLRSKTAALAVVGIGPADLGVDLGDLPPDSPEAALERQEEVREWLEEARRELVRMNESRYPLGKLNHLKAAHKGIVDTLSHFHPSSSADEIMPMLIYTLITLPPEKLNVISDLNFIQRFRWEPKIEGEAAYCLTNLEAAISFLETVDLSTLRADEAPSGPPKLSSSPGTPKTETFPPAYSQGLAVPVPSLSLAETSPGNATSVKPAPSPTGLRAAVQLRNRRLSDLVNTPAQALSTASGAVINTFNAADQGLKTIGNSLEGSYKLLFGKLGKHGDAPAGEVVVPKTLDDARKLVGTPPPQVDDDASVSGASSVHSPEDKDRDNHRRRVVSNPKDDKLLSLVGGKRPSRDHSADSTHSGGSSTRKAVLFAEETAAARKEASGSPVSAAAAAVASAAASASNAALIDSVRNLGNSLNPMSRLSGIGGFRGFGRTSSTPAAPVTRDAAAAAAAAKAVADGGDLATAFPDIAAALPPKPQVAPPVRRFMELQNPADLRISEVLELLRDYRRLAGALKDMGAFKE